MDAALARAREPLAGSGSLELPAHLLAANAELVATEHRVLVLVRQGRQDEAVAIINSDEFRQRREDYLNGLQLFSENAGHIVEELTDGVSAQVRVQTMVGVAALTVLVGGWLAIYRVLSQSERRQRLHQQRLQRHTDELAREVRDRE